MEDFCPYCNISDYMSFCTCSITNEMYGMVRRCSEKRRYVPTAHMSNCKIRKEKDNMKPEGSYKVRFCKRNILFVEIDDYVIEIENIYPEVPEYVYLIKKDGKRVLKDSIVEDVEVEVNDVIETDEDFIKEVETPTITKKKEKEKK